jgi:hypothetical protein
MGLSSDFLSRETMESGFLAVGRGGGGDRILVFQREGGQRIHIPGSIEVGDW